MFRNFLSVLTIASISNKYLALKNVSIRFISWDNVDGITCLNFKFCSDDLRFTSVISLIFESIERTPGRDSTQTSLLDSVKLLLCVKPLEPLRLAINACSMHKSGETPDQKESLLFFLQWTGLSQTPPKSLDLKSSFPIRINTMILYSYFYLIQQRWAYSVMTNDTNSSFQIVLP